MSPPQTALPWPCVSVDPPAFLLSRIAKTGAGLPLCEAPWEWWLFQVLPATLGDLYLSCPILQMSRLKHSMVWSLAQGHTAGDTRGKIWTPTVWLQNLTCNQEQHQSLIIILCVCLLAFLILGFLFPPWTKLWAWWGSRRHRLCPLWPWPPPISVA